MKTGFCEVGAGGSEGGEASGVRGALINRGETIGSGSNESAMKPGDLSTRLQSTSSSKSFSKPSVMTESEALGSVTGPLTGSS